MVKWCNMNLCDYENEDNELRLLFKLFKIVEYAYFEVAK